jgi:allantoinase
MPDRLIPPASIAAERTYLDGSFRPATVRIATDGTVAAIDPFDPGAEVVLASDAVLLPGLVDTHVHLNEPGRTAWEGFATGTAAALAGGVTTVCDMPLNSLPVTTTPRALAVKREATGGQLACDLAYWGGAVPENLGSLAELLDAGAVGVKCFMGPSGIDEFGHLDPAQITAAMTELARVDGLLIAHAELAHLLGEASGPDYPAFAASRPQRAEAEAIEILVDAARRTGARVHVVHLAAAEALDVVRRAKRAGVRITAETCPHYLSLCAEEIPPGQGRFKCCPPIRDAANRDGLWEGVLDGTIDAIVSDHSPATAELKDNPDLGQAWGGIAGVQTGLSVVWTAARDRGIGLERILPLFTTGPAALVGLDGAGELPVRGRIAVGAAAHLTVFSPDSPYTLRAADLLYRNTISPWLGADLTGSFRATYLYGAPAWDPAHGTGPAAVLTRTGKELI